MVPLIILFRFFDRVVQRLEHSLLSVLPFPGCLGMLVVSSASSSRPVGIVEGYHR